MTNFEQKYQEFRVAFRDAVLNDELECKVTEDPEWTGYIARMNFKLSPSCTIGINVANGFVCYYDNVVNNVFSVDDIEKLKAIINKHLDGQDPEKRKRIKELEKELKELKGSI